MIASGIKPLVRLGSNFTGASLCNQIRDFFPFILIGQVLGATNLAFYERAYKLMALPLSQIMPAISAVAIPAFAKIQNDNERLRNYARTLIKLTSTVTIPCSVIGILIAPEIIWVMLGDQWIKAATIFALLSPLAVTQSISSIAIWILIATGRGPAMMYFSSINLVLAISSIGIGLFFSLEVAALAFSLVGLLVRTPLLYAFLVRNTHIRWGDLIYSSAVYVFSGFILVSLGLLLRYSILKIPSPSLHWVVMCLIGVLCCWLPLLWLSGFFKIARFLDLKKSYS
jgi:PST family polysaccharide transporter